MEVGRAEAEDRRASDREKVRSIAVGLTVVVEDQEQKGGARMEIDELFSASNLSLERIFFFSNCSSERKKTGCPF